MDPRVTPGAEPDPYGLNPIFTQSSSVRLTAFGSVAQTPTKDEDSTPGAVFDGAAGPLPFSTSSPRLSRLQSMGSGGSDRPFNETPGFHAMSSYPSSGLDASPSPKDSNDNRTSRFRPTMTAVRKAKYRFSTLRSRVMHRSASGSQMGDSMQPMREASSLSVQLSGGSVFDMLNRDDRASWRAKASYWLEGIRATIAITIVVFFALFMDDFRLAVLPTQLDVSCEYISGLILVLFCFELTVASLVRSGYFASLYFWIDLAATLSMLLDITRLMDLIFRQSTMAGSPALTREPQNDAYVRLRQILRVTRIFRLMRVLKLFQQYLIHRENLKFEAESGIVAKDKLKSIPWWDPHVRRSRVGQKLSDLTSQRVIVLILTMLICIPGFNWNSGLYGGYPSAFVGGLGGLHDAYTAYGNSTSFQQQVADYVEYDRYALVNRDTGFLLILIVCNNTIGYPGGPERGWGLRTPELSSKRVWSQQCGGPNWEQCTESVAVMDVKWYSQFNSLLNMLRTIFICAILAAGVFVFNRDASRLVLEPIERMLKKVKDVSENPLAMKQGPKFGRDLREGEPQMETRILESSINKICSLLAVGFGDAGAEVIAENIRNGGDLNAMVPGQKVFAVFGFCDIRQFTDATEVLQEDVMEFVNSIAKIVHMEVSLHGGFPNKNIGDAFLLVWKFPKGINAKDLKARLAESRQAETLGLPGEVMPSSERVSTVSSATGSERGAPGQLPGRQGQLRQSLLVPGRESPRWLSLQQARDLADKALASFVVIQAALKRSRRLWAYCQREDLNKRMPNFAVRMGFGLHVGWAIEGAIGSEYKIDASYLSPNVNMASRLEAATKQFGTSILMSEDFTCMLSPQVRRRVRQIDQVTVKGSQQPMGLFTYDVSLERVPTPAQNQGTYAAYPTPSVNPRESMISQSSLGASLADMGRSQSAPDLVDDDIISYSMSAYNWEYSDHPDLACTWAVDEHFLDLWAQGFAAYREGSWQQAKQMFEQTKYMRRTLTGQPLLDGPSNTLLNFMATYDYAAPFTWKGFRELTEK